MVQVKSERDTLPENYVVRGMNNKLNYFMDEFQIYDLEYQIPQQLVSFNTMKGDGVGFKFMNQRKIFWDNSRNLSIEHMNTLNLPMNRMDITFWKNIIELNEDHTIIAANTSFKQFK